MDVNATEHLINRIEELKKWYLDGVYIHFKNGEEIKGNAAFESWNEEFRLFLEQEIPFYLQKYDQFLMKNRKDKLGLVSVHDNWKRKYGSSIMAFISQLLLELKMGKKVNSSKSDDLHLNDLPINIKRKIFIGHGHSEVWRNLKDFVVERLNLDYEEYNIEPTPGLSRKERLSQMINHSTFAFIIMTPEDEHSDGSFHARESVVHEIGLFQGRLGFNRAIVLMEDGCSEFSNIHGIDQIRFPKGQLESTFEEIRRVLEREGII
jgi:predicted nucleotide-binding protein